MLVEFRRNAKHPDREFDATLHAQEKMQTMARYADVLDNAAAWAREVIVPFARMPADWKPLAPTLQG